MSTREPTSSFQPKSPIETQNLFVFDKVKDLAPAELLREHHEFGKKIFFSHPLQRRQQYNETGCYFWYEPAGGKNAHLFEGVIIGVRTLSCGSRSDCDSYVPDASFPAYLIAFSPYRNPVYVLPWHTWVNRDEYYAHRKTATYSYERRKLNNRC